MQTGQNLAHGFPGNALIQPEPVFGAVALWVTTKTENPPPGFRQAIIALRLRYHSSLPGQQIFPILPIFP